MKIQTGIDIIEVGRIEEAIKNGGERFKEKIYTNSEIEYCEARNKNKYQHYAARFAAKEAVFKAISNIIPKNSDSFWKYIEVIKDEQGRPGINLENLKGIEIENIDISLTHIKDYALASVVVVIK